jgi:hypothetical protein
MGESQMKYIGLIGLAGSGKDTAAEALEKTHYRYAFARGLKSIARLFGWDGQKDERGRALLQDLGMAGRKYDQDIWVNGIKRLLGPEVLKSKLVFTDVRFQNEADYVRSIGGIIVRIVRPGIISGNHESELKQADIPADIEIVNDGTIEDLHNKIRNLIK